MTDTQGFFCSDFRCRSWISLWSTNFCVEYPKRWKRTRTETKY